MWNLTWLAKFSRAMKKFGIIEIKKIDDDDEIM